MTSKGGKWIKVWLKKVNGECFVVVMYLMRIKCHHTLVTTDADSIAVIEKSNLTTLYDGIMMFTS